MENLSTVLAAVVCILGVLGIVLSHAHIKKLERAQAKAATDVKLAHAELARSKEVLRGVHDALTNWWEATPEELIRAAYMRIPEVDDYQVIRARKVAAKIMGVRVAGDKGQKCST